MNGCGRRTVIGYLFLSSSSRCCLWPSMLALMMWEIMKPVKSMVRRVIATGMMSAVMVSILCVLFVF